MELIKVILYWSFCISSSVGEYNIAGVISIDHDSVTTYIPGVDYYTFKIDYIVGYDPPNKREDQVFALIGHNGNATIIVTVKPQVIIQDIHVPGLYMDRTIFIKTQPTKRQKRKHERQIIHNR